MKKLMTAVAICAVASFSLAQSVTSANVVGYSTKATPAGFLMYSAMFTTVGGGSATGRLSQITGSFDSFDSIQFVDQDGNIPLQYQWIKAGDVPGVSANGWYDFSNPPNPVDMFLPQGLSYLIATANTNLLTNSGEVRDAAITINITATGFTCIGNATPTARHISSFTFTGLASFDSIQFVDQDGNIPTQYQWIKAGDVPGVSVNGWYDFSNPPNPVDPVINSGVGFLLATSAGATVTIPSPFAP